jgi:opacity protein-like surface antigen
MMRKLLVLVASVVLGAGGGALAGARPDKDWKEWFGHVAGGISMAQGEFGDVVDDEFYVNGGATFWPEAWPIGVNLDLAYTEHDVKSSVIRKVNDALAGLGAGAISSADVEIWGLTVNGIWGPRTERPVSFYVLGGIGLDYWKGRVKDNGLVYYPPVCDPWWWWCYPGGYGPGTFVVFDESGTEFSWNGGLGVNFGLSSGSQIYIEAKYHRLETDREPTEIVPLVVGFRW